MSCCRFKEQEENTTSVTTDELACFLFHHKEELSVRERSKRAYCEQTGIIAQQDLLREYLIRKIMVNVTKKNFIEVRRSFDK